MAALSDFGWQLRMQREKLLSKLVCRLIGVQPGDDNYEVAMDFCLNQLQHHKCLDTNPKEVDRQYEGLEERLGYNALLRKQAALGTLRARLLALSLTSDQQDIHHRMLSLVYHLIGKPLESDYYGPAEEAVPDGRARKLTEDSEDGSDWAAESDVFSSGSSLSDWEGSDDDGALTENLDPNARQDPERVTGQKRESAATEAREALTARQQSHVQASSLGLTHKAAEELYPPDCLIRHLAQAQTGDSLAFLPPAPHKCTTEAALARQVMQMLRGAQKSSPAFTYHAGVFIAALGVHVPHLSPGALTAMLTQFAELGTLGARLHRFISASRDVTRSTFGHPHRPPVIGPTRAAFATALSEQIQMVNAHLVALDNSIAAAEHHGQVVTLLQLEYALQGVARRLRLLDHVVAEATGQGAGSPAEARHSTAQHGTAQHGSPAEACAHLLSSLHSMLQTYSMQSGPQGQEEAGVVLKLLAGSCLPFFGTLHAWLFDGLLQDPAGEFFIQADAAISVESPRFWYEAYALRLDTRGDIACPSFLRKQVHDILAAGKSMILLCSHQAPAVFMELTAASSLGQAHGWRCAHAAGNGPTTMLQLLREEPQGSLYQQFLRELHSLVQACSGPAEPGPEAHLGAAPLLGQVEDLADDEQPLADLEVAERMSLSHWGPQAPANLADMLRPFSPATPAKLAASRCARPGSSSADASGDDRSSCGDSESGSSDEDREVYAAPVDSVSQCAHPAGGVPGSLAQSLPADSTGRSGGRPAEAEPAPPSASTHPAGGGPGSSVRSLPADAAGQSGGHPAEAEPAQAPAPARQHHGAAATSADEVDAAALPALESQPADAAPPASVAAAATAEPPGGDTHAGAPDANGMPSFADMGARLMRLMQQSPLGAQGGGAGAAAVGPPGGSAQPLARQRRPEPTRLAAYQGRVALQLWAKHKGLPQRRSAAQEEAEQAWLAGVQQVDLPPIDVVLETCIARPISMQVDRVGERLLNNLLGRWGLMYELSTLRNVFLLACPGLLPFAGALFDRLNHGESLRDISDADLTFMLQQSLPSHTSADDPMPPADALTATVARADPTARRLSMRATAVGTPLRNISELSPLRVQYRVAWPLSMIVDDQVLLKYNQVLIFLLQVRWASAALERARKASLPGAAGRGLQPGDVLAQEMGHFVNNLHQFVMERLLHGAWHQLQQDLDRARSLDEVTAAHGTFLDSVQRQCLLAPDKTWKLIEDAVFRILNLVLHFAALQQALNKPQQGAAASATRVLQGELAELQTAFRDRHRYLLKVLTAKTLKIGGYSELHHLVMRLNFNSFYPEAE